MKADVYRRGHAITQDSLDDLRDSIRDAKEDLGDQLDRLLESVSATDNSIRGSLHGDQALLQRSLESLEQAQRIADTSFPKVTVRKNRSQEGSRAIFGTDTSHPQFNLDVSNNDVGVGAVAAAGVHTPQTLQALLGHSRSYDLAFTLQADQAVNDRIQGAYGHSLNSIRPFSSDEPSDVTQRANSRISEDTSTVG